MLRIFCASLTIAAFLVCESQAWSQNRPRYAGGTRGPEASPGVSYGARTGRSAVTQPRGMRHSGGSARQGPARGRTAGTADGRSFATRLGETVGLRALPSVAVPPVGNVNRPGVAPTGALSPVPNINDPAGTLIRRGFQVPSFGGHAQMPHRWKRSFPRRGNFDRGDHFGRRSSRLVVTVPLAVPYYIPYTAYSTTYYAVPAPAEPPLPPVPPSPSTSYYQPGNGPQPEEQPAEPQEPEETSAEKPLTLLAFRDHTIVAVTDYWMEGDRIYYETTYNPVSSISFDQLDWVLTQQLNQERNIPFVLESRP